MFASLTEIAKVSLGFKSLQNQFYYLDETTIDTYGIESRYLKPILMLRDMDSSIFFQNPGISQWLFDCRIPKRDLRGTGALKYIESMADRSAKQKKQSGKFQTIREALEAQGGNIWYAPKARPHKHHVWLRKAINGVFSPFLLSTPTLVDQRLNSITPVTGIGWKELAAVLTTSLFSFSIEINGSAGLGAGALEAATTKVQEYPVLDIRQLSKKKKGELVMLAEEVWNNESPVDWSDAIPKPGPALVALDKWALDTIGSEVPIQRLYDDLKQACHSRISLAKDKTRKTKKQKQDSTERVAQAITKAVEVTVKSRNFPDDFIGDAELDIPFTFDRLSLRTITILPLINMQEIKIINSNGELVFKGNYSLPVAESIIRAILWGRSTFSIKDDRKLMNSAVSKFITFVSDVEKKIDELIAESAMGTGYEERLKNEVFRQLGIHPLVGSSELPTQITLAIG